MKFSEEVLGHLFISFVYFRSADAWTQSFSRRSKNWQCFPRSSCIIFRQFSQQLDDGKTVMWKIWNFYGLQSGTLGKRTKLAALIILGTKILSLPAIFSWLDPFFGALRKGPKRPTPRSQTALPLNFFWILWNFFSIYDQGPTKPRYYSSFMQKSKTFNSAIQSLSKSR